VDLPHRQRPPAHPNYYLVKSSPTRPPRSGRHRRRTAASSNPAGIFSTVWPGITADTELADVLRFDGTSSSGLHRLGTLHFSAVKAAHPGDQGCPHHPSEHGQKPGHLHADALGIQPVQARIRQPIPTTRDRVGAGFRVSAEGLMSGTTHGQRRRNRLSGLKMPPTTSRHRPSPSISPSLDPAGKGQSAVGRHDRSTILWAYPSPCVSRPLDQRTSTFTAYRWFADAAENDRPRAKIAVGEGSQVRRSGNTSLPAATREGSTGARAFH